MSNARAGRARCVRVLTALLAGVAAVALCVPTAQATGSRLAQHPSTSAVASGARLDLQGALWRPEAQEAGKALAMKLGDQLAPRVAGYLVDPHGGAAVLNVLDEA